MSKMASALKAKSAYKAGRAGRHLFNLHKLKHVPRGGKAGSKDHDANTRAVVIEGERIQVARVQSGGGRLAAFAWTQLD